VTRAYEVADAGDASRERRLRARVFELLEAAGDGDSLSRCVDLVLVALIILSVAAVILESIPSVGQRYGDAFYWFEALTVSIFSIEYLLRIWSCVEAPTYADRGSLRARLRFAVSFHALIDLIAILPFFLVTFAAIGGADMRFLRAIRLLRVLKLMRYSPALNMLVATVAENGRNLAAAFFILITIMLLAASGIYYFERDAQPLAFGSIPAAMWWAFATLTTVGYGDVTPVTVGGKVFGACITVVGLGMVALPTGIIASGFAEQLRTRSARFRARADSAWDDGVLTDGEINELEALRRDLGLGKFTASQILDAGRVQRMLADESAGRCPHCGEAVVKSP